MENLEQNTVPQEAADVNAASGQTDANETQPAETEEVVDGNEAAETGEASNPWDNDPKFKGKAPEDIYKAYKEAEKLTGQLSQKAQVANLIQEKYGVTPEELRARIDQQEQENKRQLYANNPLAPVLDEVAQLRQRIEQQDNQNALMSEQKAMDEFLKENPEYQANRDQLLKLALTPGIGFDPETGESKSHEELAKEWFGKVRAQGQEDAYRKIDTKKISQTQSTSAPQRKVSIQDMENMPIEDLREIMGTK